MKDTLYDELKNRLAGLIVPKRAVVGLDGFIDEILAVVDKRLNGTGYTRIETIEDYGNRILEGSGLSLNLEVVTLAKKIGGNGPIYAGGLKKLGVKTDYIGAIGVNKVHSIFSELISEDCSITGVAEPAHTDAYEFRDGKIITSRLETLNTLTWEKIQEIVPQGRWVSLMERADIFSLNNWTMIPEMNRIWEHILDEVVPVMNVDLQNKIAFFDLADPRKREDKDILDALELIRRFSSCGFRTMLGLNFKESQQIISLVGKNGNMDSLEDSARCIAEYLNIECVAVHRTDIASSVQNGVYTEAAGPYCKKPRIKTGCGDIFNSGFVFAQAQGWPQDVCLMMGAMTSGYYVRNAQTAAIEDIIACCVEGGFSDEYEC